MNHSATLTEDNVEKIRQIDWFHSIRLGSIVTPGVTDVFTQQWTSQAIPEDLSGMTVLDVGAWDGYYSFLAEACGARRVLAIDVVQQGGHNRGFLLAKRILRSKVEYRFHSVYDLDGLREKFDLILFLGVYYHLVDPILALQQIYNALNDGGILVLEGGVLCGRKPYLRSYRPEEVKPTTAYCAATIPWFQVIGKQIGYQNFELVSIRMERRPAGRIPWKRFVRSLAWKFGLAGEGGPFKGYRVLIRMKHGRE